MPPFSRGLLQCKWTVE